MYRLRTKPSPQGRHEDVPVTRILTGAARLVRKTSGSLCWTSRCGLMFSSAHVV